MGTDDWSRLAHSTLILWDSGCDPLTQTESGYRWDGYAESDSVLSLLRYVDINAERLRHKYLAWVHELGESRIDGKRIIDHFAFGDGLSYWWMTLLAEKSHYKSRIADAIRLLALEEIIAEQKPEKLKLVSANRQLHQAVLGLCGEFGTEYQWDRQPDRQPRSKSLLTIYRRLPYSFQALFALFRHAWNRWPLRCTGKRNWFGGEGSLFVCSYFDNVAPDAAARAVFQSYYWGGMHGLLKRAGYRSNWLHLFVRSAPIPTPSAAVDCAQRFNQIQQNTDFHAFLDGYLSWRVFLRVLSRWFSLGIIAGRLGDISRVFRPPGSRLSLWPLMREDWVASLRGPAAITSLLSIELFDEALRDMPRQKKGLYLCENQGWERALIHAWRKHGHGCLIAVAHSTVRFWDMRYFFDSRTIRSRDPYLLPQPDLVALNGKAAVDAFLDAGYPQDAIVECEALRYEYLGKNESWTSLQPVGIRRKVLVLGDVMAVATTRLLKLLEASVACNPDAMVYVVKPHPNCPVREEEYPTLKLEVVNDPLATIVRDCDIAYASNSTSAAVDAYLAGLSVVVMLDDAELNFSPLRGQPGVHFVSTPEQLAEALRTLFHKSVARPDSKKFFTLDPDLPRWSRLLAN